MITSLETLSYYTTLFRRHEELLGSRGKRYIYSVTEDKVVRFYEAIRSCYVEGASQRKKADELRVSREVFGRYMESYFANGVISLFPDLVINGRFNSTMEYQIVVLKKGKPKLRTNSIAQIVNALNPQLSVTNEDVSQVLSCHGLSQKQGEDGFDFTEWQRLLEGLELAKERLKSSSLNRDDFIRPNDSVQGRLEIMRELSCSEEKINIGDFSASHGLTRMTLYTLLERFSKYGSLGLINKAGGKSRGGVITYEIEAEIVLKKLSSPEMSAQSLAEYFSRKFSIPNDRAGILKLYQVWHLAKADKIVGHFEEAYDTSKELDDKLKATETSISEDIAQPSAKRSHPSNLTATKVEGRFASLLKEMTDKPLAICNPGPLLMAGSIDRLGLYESFMSLSTTLPKEELFYMFLLNINRIIAGVSTISRLDNLMDRGIALASGLAQLPASHTMHEYLKLVSPGIIDSLRRDLVIRAKELGLTRGNRVAFDFHMIEFYGDVENNGSISFGPNTQKGKMVPGFRPHVSWDLDTNTIGSIVFGYGKGRGTTSIRRFVKEQVLSCLGKGVLKEVYMDSEYTGMDILEFFVGLGAHVTMCLKRNKKIEKLAQQAMQKDEWEKYDNDYEICSIIAQLPSSGKEFIFVVSRRFQDGKIRCFGSTKTWLTPAEVLDDYKGRWAIETGIKDLEYSYFINNTPGIDPAKIDAHFFCVMYARLVVDHFINELGGIIKEDRNRSKRTLSSLRDIYLTQKNCLLQRRGEYLVLTFLDEMAPKYQELIRSLWAKRTLAFIESKIPWWGGLRLDIDFKPQRSLPRASARLNTINIWDILSPIDN